MDFSFLSQPAQLQLPDPTAMAVRGQTLANLTQQNQENQYKLDAMKQAQEVKIAAGKVFGDAQTMGWDAAIRKAAQEGNNLGAAAALQLRRDDEGAAAKVDNDRAQAEERRSLALKNTTGAKAEAFKTFAPLVTGLASGQVPVNDQTQSAVYESARALLPENVVRTMPSDPAQMANWAKQFADPTVLNTLWKDSQEVPAKVGLDNANANRANVEAQYIPQDSASRRMTAGAAVSNAATSAQRLAFDQSGNGADKWVNDLPRGVQVNMATGATRPITAGGAPIGAVKDAKTSQNLDKVDAILQEAVPLIEKSTGSGAGWLYDEAAQLVGKATPGAVAGNDLKTLSGALISAMPRMEGPQSDADRKLYQEAAGDIANTRVPREMRLQAVKTIQRLQQQYRQINSGTYTPSAPESSAPTSPSPGFGKVEKIGGR